jgi:N-glycosylase/DNA lyase
MAGGRSMAAGDFDLRVTLESGQIFHAIEEDGWWWVLAGREPLVLRQPAPGSLEMRTGSPRLARRYFSLDHPLGEIYETFPRDSYSRAALEGSRGLRIIRQPAWECLATFVTSSMKQVAHIRLMSMAIRQRFGDPVSGARVNAYPAPERIAALDEAALRACGLGFRAGHLLGAARALVRDGKDLESLRSLPTAGLRARLEALPGVGPKVANCVLLFAYERLDAVPVDVWIGRIARAMRRRKLSAPALARFATRRFGPYAGYVQQYLFHHARTTGRLPA